MRKSVSVLTLVTALLLLLPTPPLFACGDKLMSIARSIRLQHAYRTRHPANILVYAGRAVDARKNGKKDLLVQMSLMYMSLRLAGHRPAAAETVTELDAALSDGRFDFVVADLADMSVVKERIEALHSKASVLPIVYKLSRAEVDAAKLQYQYVLKAPARSIQHLEAIDEAIKARAVAASGP